jgi:DNA modification methylase
MGEAGFKLRQLIIWNKMRFIIGRGDYSYNHDPCFYGVRENRKSHWSGARNQPTVWDIAHKASDTNHGAQKPVECMKRPIENNSSPGQAVYDPFVGSGTTIIAAEMTGRACHAIELNPAYVDVAVQRWQNFTGKQATLEADGRTFDEVARERAETRPGPAALQAVA